MVALTSGQLVWIAVVLLVIGLLLNGSAERSRISAAIRSLSFVVAAAALLAAAITWLAPTDAAGLTSETLAELNEAVREYRHLAEKWTWAAIVLAGLSLTVLAFVGWIDLTSRRAIRFHRFAITAAAAKVVLAIVATGSFVASGFTQHSQESEKEASDAAERLTKLQYTVFAKVSQTVRVQLIQAALAPESAGSDAPGATSPVVATYAAFNVVAPYMQRPEGLTDGKTTTNELSSSASPPEIFTKDAETLAKAFEAEQNSRPKDALSDDIAAVAFDMNASEST